MPHSQNNSGNSKSRVLCITEDLGRGGGAEHLLVSLLPEIKKKGYEVEVAALFNYPNNLRADVEAQGVRAHLLNLPRRWSVLHNIQVLRTLARLRGCKVFWGNLYFGNLYACLLALTSPGTKAVVTLHSEGYSQAPPRRLKEYGYAMMERLVLSRAQAKVAVSRAVAFDYASFFGWQDIDIIHNGLIVNIDFQPMESGQRRTVRASLGVEEEEFLVVVPARFVPEKGHAALLEALAGLKAEKSWRPKVAAFGHGPLRDSLWAKAEQLGLSDQVTFYDLIPQAELFSRLRAADAVCLPSLREAFGLAAAEAMALGAPMILTKVGGFPELVGDSGGALMVPPRDPVALASALWRLYEEPALRRDLGERARLRISENFDISVCASNWASLFERLAK